ncbi:MAG: hypothetical protein WBY53_19655 [Acidobacteriaceae bacterium]
MGQRSLALVLCLASTVASAQQPTSPASAQQLASAATQPSPTAQDQDIPQLLHDVEQHEKDAEAARRDYTWHVHFELQQLDHNGNVKKTTTTDAESISIEGVRIDRTVARDGKPLTPDEAQKECDRIDKEVARAKSRRERLAERGEPSDSRGDPIIPVSRILELGAFTNPRRVLLDNRPTIVLDYAGDPHAKTRNESEGIIRDLVGTVWIDQQDRVLVRGQGHFLHDFKIGAGLLLNIHQGLTFDFRTAHITGDVWLPSTVDGEGSARILLFDHIDGRFHLTTSNYRKFHTTTTIIDSNRLINPNGQPTPTNPPPSAKPQP